MVYPLILTIDSTAIAIPIVVAIIAAAGTYLATKRQHSGKINTSEADILWREAGELRDFYKNEVASLRLEVTELRKELAHLRVELANTRAQAERLRDEAEKWRIMVGEL